MKNAMDWIKGHWLILAIMGAAVIALPVMLYFSTSMSAAARTEIEGKIKGDWNDLNNGPKLTYKAPGVPDWPATAPNAKLNEWFKARMEETSGEAGLVVQQAVAANKGNHAMLIAGLFPEPQKNDDRRLRVEFSRRYILETHDAMLRSINAGSPPDGAGLAAELLAYQTERVKAKLGADTADMTKLAPVEREEIAKAVLGQRVGAYQRQASRISLYADINCFRLPAFRDDPPSLSEEWLQQHEFWIQEDLIAAIGLANKSGSGGGVGGSVVKRLESISVDPFPGVIVSSGGPDFGRGAPGVDPTPAAPGGEAPVDYTRSATGRFSGPGSNNGLYDVRTARMTIVASTRNLPLLFDALGKVNFMSVLDVDVEKVDPVAEMNAGFYYGDEHVSRVSLTIETIWLRAWTAKDMPKEIKNSLGIPLDQPAPPPAG